LLKIAREVPHPVGQRDRLTDAQTDTQTDRGAYHNTSPPLPRAK